MGGPFPSTGTLGESFRQPAAASKQRTRRPHFGPPAPATIELPPDFEDLNPWQWEMTLLTCARRHRALLWSARVRSRRRGGRSPRSARVAATGLAAAAATASAKQPPLSTTSRAASTLSQSQSQSPPKTDNSLVMARENAAASNRTTERPERESATPETSWSAMLIALFGLIQPEWAKEVSGATRGRRCEDDADRREWIQPKAEVEDECADELRVNSVPPHVSDVVASSDKGTIGLMWLTVGGKDVGRGG